MLKKQKEGCKQRHGTKRRILSQEGGSLGQRGRSETELVAHLVIVVCILVLAVHLPALWSEAL
jgi:hypothetical protein